MNIYLLKQLDIVTPYQLYFNPELIFKNFQVNKLEKLFHIFHFFLKCSGMETGHKFLLFWSDRIQLFVQHAFYVSVL